MAFLRNRYKCLFNVQPKGTVHVPLIFYDYSVSLGYYFEMRL